MASALENTLIEIIAQINSLKAEIDDIKSQLGETTSVDAGPTFPSEPHDNQIFLRSDEGSNGGGILYRYDQNASDWVELN